MEKLINKLNKNFREYCAKSDIWEYEKVKNDYELTTFENINGSKRVKLFLHGLLWNVLGLEYDGETLDEMFKLPKGYYFEAESATKWILQKD